MQIKEFFYKAMRNFITALFTFFFHIKQRTLCRQSLKSNECHEKRIKRHKE